MGKAPKKNQTKSYRDDPTSRANPHIPTQRAQVNRDWTEDGMDGELEKASKKSPKRSGSRKRAKSPTPIDWGTDDDDDLEIPVSNAKWFKGPGRPASRFGDGSDGEEPMDEDGGQLRMAGDMTGGGGQRETSFTQEAPMRLGGTGYTIRDTENRDALIDYTISMLPPQLYYPFMWTKRLREDWQKIADSKLYTHWRWNNFTVKVINLKQFSENTVANQMTVYNVPVKDGWLNKGTISKNIERATTATVYRRYMDLEMLLDKVDVPGVSNYFNEIGLTYQAKSTPAVPTAESLNDNHVLAKMRRNTNDPVPDPDDPDGQAMYREVNVNNTLIYPHSGAKDKINNYIGPTVPTTGILTFKQKPYHEIPNMETKDVRLLRDRNEVKNCEQKTVFDINCTIPQGNLPIIQMYYHLKWSRDATQYPPDTAELVAQNEKTSDSPPSELWIPCKPWLIYKMFDEGKHIGYKSLDSGSTMLPNTYSDNYYLYMPGMSGPPRVYDTFSVQMNYNKQAKNIPTFVNVQTTTQAAIQFMKNPLLTDNPEFYSDTHNTQGVNMAAQPTREYGTTDLKNVPLVLNL